MGKKGILTGIDRYKTILHSAQVSGVTCDRKN